MAVSETTTTISNDVRCADPPVLIAVRTDVAHSEFDADADQRRAEAGLLRSALLGSVTGAVVCAAIWTGLVAMATVGAGVALVPTLAMAAGCGVFAGLFLGGCAGALAGSRGLEHVEHERMHRGRHDASA